MPKRLRFALPWICVVLFLIGIGNFMWFFEESLSLGGDALNGDVRDGHYFVRSHGRYTEVPAGTWNWSRAHGISVFVTHPWPSGPVRTNANPR